MKKQAAVYHNRRLLTGHVPDGIRSIWDKAPLQRTPAEWSFRWLWNHPELTIVLCGMNEEEHVDENIRIANDGLPGSLSQDELAVIDEVRDALQDMLKVGCTGCRYCMP